MCQFARDIGMLPATLSQLETQGQDCRLAHIVRIKRGLNRQGVKLSWVDLGKIIDEFYGNDQF